MDNNHLYEQLVKLGDLMGDGCHLEPDGKWIEEQYNHIVMLLGLAPQTKRRDTNSINEFMNNRLQEVICECGGKLSQSRSGSFVADCNACGKRYRLGRRSRK